MVLAKFFEKASAGFCFRYTVVDSWGNVCSGESGIIREKNGGLKKMVVFLAKVGVFVKSVK